MSFFDPKVIAGWNQCAVPHLFSLSTVESGCLLVCACLCMCVCVYMNLQHIFWFSAHMSLTLECYFNPRPYPCLSCCFCQLSSHHLLVCVFIPFGMGRRRRWLYLSLRETWSHFLWHSSVLIFHYCICDGHTILMFKPLVLLLHCSVLFRRVIVLIWREIFKIAVTLLRCLKLLNFIFFFLPAAIFRLHDFSNRTFADGIM